MESNGQEHREHGETETYKHHGKGQINKTSMGVMKALRERQTNRQTRRVYKRLMRRAK